MSLQIDKTDGENGSNALSDTSEGEDQDEPSFQQSTEEKIDDTLKAFRETWQQELQLSPNRNHLIQNVSTEQKNSITDYELKAKMLYLTGVEMEKSGKLYEAIQYYRRAVQLVPDIEFRLSNVNKLIRDQQISNDCDDKELNNKEDNGNKSDDNNDDSDEDKEFIEWELLPRIQKKLSKQSTIFIPEFEQKATHISALPMEMILYILRWLVSSDLDMRSLEICSMTCRGFYQCARDPEIWHLACLKVWGLNCGSCPKPYLSWRSMFIEKTRLSFNGCYIGKTTYFRHGENNFQDQFYRPWHLVEYYRYLRFFPDGLVLVLTSSDEPSQCVGQMKYRNARSPVLKGFYRLKDDQVTLIVQRNDKHTNQACKSNKKRDNLHDSAEQTFHMELQIKNNKKKKHFQLIWKHYSVFTRTIIGDESTCNFDIVTNRFPPFWFSRVRSYTAESDRPLQ